MKATGIIRRIDDLGRIVIPKEIRRQLKITDGDPLEIFLTTDNEIVLKPYRVQEYTLRRSENWEELIVNGEVVCGNHKLDATEILNALRIDYNEEEFEEDEQSSFPISKLWRRASDCLARFFIIPQPPPICQAKNEKKVAQNYLPKFG